MDNINEIELKNEIVPIKEKAEGLIIATDDDNISAANFLMTIKEMIKKVKEKFAPAKDNAWKAHKAITALESEILMPLEKAELNLKGKMVAFEREAEKERRRLQDIQDAKARQVEAEAQKAAEQAAKLADKGKDEKAEVKTQVAETLQVKADEIRQTVIVSPMTRNAGISYKDNWTAIVKDIALVPREYLVPNMTALNGLAKATKGTVSIPGVEFVNNRTVSSRSY